MREDLYARDKLKFWANAPFPLSPQRSVQKWGVYFQELTVTTGYTPITC